MDETRWLACTLGPCPQCGNGRLEVVFDGQDRNLLCPRCGACWHAEMDGAHRVDALACPGCSERDTCTTARLAWAAAVDPPTVLEGRRYVLTDETGSPVVDWGAPVAGR